jgi:hypothetical protein
MAEKITNNADETNIQDLLETQCLFEVPYFQRPYKWKPGKLRNFFEDLIRLVDDGPDETHFVGAVIIQGQQAPPTVARSYQVIDGQQRITTMFLILLGFIRAYIELGDVTTAKNLFEAYIVTTRDTRGKSNLKLHPSGADRGDLNDVVSEVLNLQNFKEVIAPTTVKFLDVGGANPSHRISKNFAEIKKILREEILASEDKHLRLEHLYTVLLQSVTLVQIDIKDPLMGPVIFDRLNSGQEQMTVGELVKNDVLSRGSHLTDAEREALEKDSWQPFFKQFGNPDEKKFDTYLFPFGLIRLDPNVRKGDVYQRLRKEWSDRDLSITEIIDDLASLQKEFLDLCDGKNRCEFGFELNSQIQNLKNVGLPTMMFSFVMKVLNEVRLSKLDEGVGTECLKYVESFIVRRGAFGLEPSGLHAAFKGMWSEIEAESKRAIENGNVPVTLARGFATSISKRATVKWPNRLEFEASLRDRDLYGSKITRYLLSEFNRSLPGDQADIDGVEIEHILPQSMSAIWQRDFSSDQHKTLVNKLGNLTLLTEPMNKEVSNGGFVKKREKYIDSKYAMTRKIARECNFWTPTEISNRAEEIINWAVSRWVEE